MKKLTKKQRHEIYKKILISFLNPVNENGTGFYTAKYHKLRKARWGGTSPYLCDHFNALSENEGISHFFIEFHLFEPIRKKDIPGYSWFNCIEARQQVLMFCIEMTRP